MPFFGGSGKLGSPLETAMDQGLAKSPGDVIFGLFLAGVGEDFLGLVKFDEVSKKKEARKIRYTSSLLHIVCYDDDREVFFEFKD